MRHTSISHSFLELLKRHAIRQSQAALRASYALTLKLLKHQPKSTSISVHLSTFQSTNRKSHAFLTLELLKSHLKISRASLSPTFSLSHSLELLKRLMTISHT